MDSVRAHMAAKLKELRKASDMNVDQVGDALGKSGKTISAWEVGRGQPDADELLKLCKLFNARVADFYGEKAKSDESDFTDIPLYGSIAAGTPIEMIPVEDYHPVPTAVHKRYPDGFLLKVTGSSMDRVLPDGCYALVDPCKTIEHNGDPYAVCVNGYDATIKRVRKLNNGFELVPDSTDPTYPVQTFNYNEPGTETITVIGRVVYYVLPFDWGF